MAKTLALSKKQSAKKVTLVPNKTVFEKLWRMNLGAAALHFLSAVLMLLLAKSRAPQPISATYLTYNSTTQQLESATHHLFNLPLLWLVVGFALMSAAAHLIIATVYRKRYETDLEAGINKARWVEYSISASTMMVAIALLTGIFDAGALLAIFVLTAGMNLMGLMMEKINQKRAKVQWFSYVLGCIFGIIPWLMIALGFWAANVYGSGGIPTFVYWIYVSIFIFFNSFAVNMVLQYRRRGLWSDYLFGERVYIILSFVAKAALAWQVFAGTLRP